tara:strand:- start:664 stop:1134 length:471 start_codon:yes stop_codon:yes gene_type:complete
MKKDTTEISPFTGKESVIVEIVDGKTSKICMDSGYMTNDDFSIDNSELLSKYEESMPKLMIEKKHKDTDLGQYWYLTSIQFRTGMIYPQPDKNNEYEWVFAPIMSLDAEEQKQYPVPGKDDEFYNTRLATEHAEYYTKHNFSGACKRAGAVITADE